MKKRYIKPALEAYAYRPEKGYAVTVALYKEHVLMEGDDHETVRAGEEVTEDSD